MGSIALDATVGTGGDAVGDDAGVAIGLRREKCQIRKQKQHDEKAYAHTYAPRQWFDSMPAGG